MIKVVLVMWRTDVEYSFNIWENGSILGSLTYIVGKGLHKWANNSNSLRELLRDEDKTNRVEKLMEDEIAKRAIESEILT